MFRFVNPWLLLLLIPAIIAMIIQLYRKPPSIVVSSVEHFSGQKGTSKPKLGFLTIPILLEFIGIVLLVVALARPQSGKEVVLDINNGIDIALCLDVSGSMEYFDPDKNESFSKIARKINEGELKPRIEIAKEELNRFIDKRPHDRLGIFVFATQPYQLAPLTIDKKLLTARMEEVSTTMLGEFRGGTGIAAPLASAIQRLKNSKAKRRVIILFTDGANNQDQELTPLQAAELASEFNITIHTVGIGSPSAVRKSRHIFMNNYSLTQAAYQFDEELMQKLAENTKGQYFHVKDRESFTEVMDSIDKLEKVELRQPRHMNYKDLFPSLLYSGIALLGLAFLLTKTIWLRVP
ncbi:MAG: VWA domain-containing protein [Lentisphaeraceae bacterium]|nr:VWA domain-containing protein [Lentisphaeraceae bacterium]